MKFAFILSSLLVVCASQAKDFSNYDFIETMQCEKNRSHKDRRFIGVAKKEKGCLTVYEKEGVAKEVAQAQQGTEYCLEIMERISINLTESKFKCL
ncbi:MAG: hypothetical protein KDD33_10990 [Bdellovibrionales bacterium]|nr:hypothetical protein [Bdellovibrionales bacterium]